MYAETLAGMRPPFVRSRPWSRGWSVRRELAENVEPADETHPRYGLLLGLYQPE